MKDRSNMRRHVMTHLSEASFVCSTCGLKYFTRRGLTMHSCEKGKFEMKLMSHRYCRMCDSTFSSSHEKKTHKCPYEDPNDPKLVNCRYCGKSVVKAHYARHAEYAHSEKKWVCMICNAPMPTKHVLKSKKPISHCIEILTIPSFSSHGNSHGRSIDFL